MNFSYSIKDSLLVLRLHRLNHIPPARQSAELLNEAGIPIVVFEFGDAPRTISLAEGGLPTNRLGARWAAALPRKLRATAILFHALFVLLRLISRQKPRLIETHGIPEQFLAWVVHRVYGVDYVSHVHEIYEARELSNLNRILFAYEGPALRAAKFTIFPSKERAAIYQLRYRLTTKPEIVFNAPRQRTPKPRPDFYSQTGVDAQSKVALYIGGIAELNATEAVIEAAAHWPSNCVLVLAGWGEETYLNKLKEKVLALGLGSRVKFVGPVKNKWDWIDNADLGICLYKGVELRSRYNAGPSNKLFEFISAGKPVVTNAAPDFKAIVEAERLGLTVDPSRPEEIAAAITRLVNEINPKTIQDRALLLHQARYNYETQFASVLERFLSFFPAPASASQSKAA